MAITFDGDELEVILSYKYLDLVFDYSCSYNSYVWKWVVGGMNSLYSMQNKCREKKYELEFEEDELQVIDTNIDFAWFSCLGSQLFK